MYSVCIHIHKKTFNDKHKKCLVMLISAKKHPQINIQCTYMHTKHSEVKNRNQLIDNRPQYL